MFIMNDRRSFPSHNFSKISIECAGTIITDLNGFHICSSLKNNELLGNIT